MPTVVETPPAWVYLIFGGGGALAALLLVAVTAAVHQRLAAR